MENSNVSFIDEKELSEWKDMTERKMRVGVRVLIAEKLKKANARFDLYAKLFNAFLEFVLSKGFLSVNNAKLMDIITNHMLEECDIVLGKDVKDKISSCL